MKRTALGTASLALTPSFTHLRAASAKHSVRFPHRFVFIRKSNGNLPTQFGLPSFSAEELKKHEEKESFEVDLSKHELPDWLKGLDEHKENITILHGISMSVSGGGHYSYSGCMGAYKAGRDILSNIKRATIDFELAKLFPSPFGHVEMSLAVPHGRDHRTGIVSGYSAPAAKQRNYCYADPMTAHQELFKSVTNTSEAESDRALLDYLHDKERRQLKGLDGDERLKISDQVDSLQSIRDRNAKVESLGAKIKQHLPDIDPIHANGGANATLPQKQAAFTDVIIGALASGITNVVTYTIDDLGTDITSLPENTQKTSIHQIGHGGQISGAALMRDAIKTHHIKQVRTLVTQLKSVPEGNGTMFDNTTIIYMPETGAGHHGPDTEAPMVLMTGKNSKLDLAGRYVRLPFHGTEGHKTLSNWYTTLLNAYGSPIEHYGDLDLTMQRNRLKQTGAIDRFLI
ncbi:MAG: DUF1552 domain-containing protein [Verrucomicrobia bacterium]|nr:DUF1552 domain-containing protein [Verrucomicrobiota bacterium]MDA1045855.1 DUF1552 domain-containing protein [Verrucomicrobiota bacterium]